MKSKSKMEICMLHISLNFPCNRFRPRSDFYVLLCIADYTANAIQIIIIIGFYY